ncbi:molecular chaperone Tir [Enterobacteriaceae bacterium H18W14]|uniref:TIR domain-containing protein n=1 Tax=Dryocola boscaweniae TaxID=2925397 RepID=UPI0022F09D09|nr:TIR domain-containing protein [Dryocola boscaweniae]MCT4715621.1 molecular chaperone Tir [Dryocola boscaweniae]
MSYRNKTYVAFASEDIHLYRLMEAWRDNKNIDFNFYDAHDLFKARDSSKPETIKSRLRERLYNAKQVVLIGSSHCKKKGGDGVSFLAHEIKVIQELNLPIVVANHDSDRYIDRNFIPQPLLDANYYTISVSFQPKIIQFALDEYCPVFSSGANNKGPHYYEPHIYNGLGL